MCVCKDPQQRTGAGHHCGRAERQGQFNDAPEAVFLALTGGNVVRCHRQDASASHLDKSRDTNIVILHADRGKAPVRNQDGNPFIRCHPQFIVKTPQYIVYLVVRDGCAVLSVQKLHVLVTVVTVETTACGHPDESVAVLCERMDIAVGNVCIESDGAVVFRDKGRAAT